MGNELISNNERGLSKPISDYVANKLRDLADELQTGKIQNVECATYNGVTNISFDSPDGNIRLIEEVSSHGGLSQRVVTRGEKLSTEQRREAVKAMVLDKRTNFTQAMMAKRTMTSQKTISNDIKKLRESGELPQ